ncbi:MAG: hypothetical protein KF724_12800 [Phycisphaeraceae bacterium]|nr:hypothetical protein [Phycisphaeraceae bacterium]
MNQPQAADDGSAIVVTAAAVRTALGASRAEILRRAMARERSLAPSAALEGARPDDRTYACSGLSSGPDRAEDLLARVLADALEEAHLHEPARRGSRRVQIVVGTTLHGMRHLGDYLRSGGAKGAGFLTPASVASLAAARCGLPAGGVTVSTACASGITTIGIACDLLRLGDADVVLAGGYDPVSEFSYAGFESLRLLAEDAPRPFARDRDGMRTAEGAAVLVIERASSARARGARVLARVAAMAESSDAFHLTQPHPEGEGAADALREALQRGGGDPDLIVAHATGTDANDHSEYRAYERVFGERLARIPVTASKSVYGHTLGAAGAVDAALCIAMLEARSVLPTMTGADSIDRATFPLLDLVTDRRDGPIARTLNMAVGFGGSNAALMLVAPHPAEPGVRAPMSPTAGPETTHGRSTPSLDRPSQNPTAPLRSDDLTRKPGSDDAICITGLAVIVPGAAHRGREVAGLDGVEPGDVDPNLLEPHLDVRAARRIAPISKLVRAAVRLAIDDARLSAEHLRQAHAICATQHAAVGYSVDAYREVLAHGLRGGNPLLFAESVPNVPGAQCSLAFGVKGPTITVFGSRIAFIEAAWIAMARMQARGVARVILVAAEERHERLDEVLSAWRQPRCGDPGTASGAVAMILERADAARERGAAVYATLGAAKWMAPAARRPRDMLVAARSMVDGVMGPIDAPARPGLLGRLERRTAGQRLERTLGAELHAVGPALLAALRAVRGENGAVLAVESFGATGLIEIFGAKLQSK